MHPCFVALCHPHLDYGESPPTRVTNQEREAETYAPLWGSNDPQGRTPEHVVLGVIELSATMRGFPSFIAVVESAHTRQRHNLRIGRWSRVDRSPVGRILFEVAGPRLDRAGHVLAAALRRFDLAVPLRALRNVYGLAAIQRQGIVHQLLATFTASHTPNAHATDFTDISRHVVLRSWGKNPRHSYIERLTGVSTHFMLILEENAL